MKPLVLIRLVNQSLTHLVPLQSPFLAMYRVFNLDCELFTDISVIHVLLKYSESVHYLPKSTDHDFNAISTHKSLSTYQTNSILYSCITRFHDACGVQYGTNRILKWQCLSHWFVVLNYFSRRLKLEESFKLVKWCDPSDRVIFYETKKYNYFHCVH